jgi:TraM recognition site of TraD and TraG/YWFCY protein
MELLMLNKGSSFRLAAGFCCGGLLLFHAYYYCNAGFAEWGLTAPIVDRLARAFAGVAILSSRDSSKVAIIIALALTQVGVAVAGFMPGRREVVRGVSVGLLVYFGSDGLLYLTGDPAALSSAYLLVMGVGSVIMYRFIKPLTGWVSVRLSQDIFNRFNESFPQEERHIPAPFSLHLKGEYRFRNQVRNCVINLVNIMRGTLVIGNPGSGKTRYIIRPVIRQGLELGMAGFVYDLKYPDLSEYVWWCLNRNKLLNDPRVYYSLNFDELSKSHRCNPLHPRGLHDINDAMECSRTILQALDKQMAHREGGFFALSAVNFVTAGIWFLRSYEKGRYCTLPHLIELLQHKQSRLLSILMSYAEIRSVIGSFAEAYEESVTDQVQGQVDSARVMLAALASPAFYYLLSGDDFSLDINNPAAPKVVCMGSSPQKAHIYGVAVSLMMNRMLKEINRREGVASLVIVDEFASIRVTGMPEALATARSNQVAIILGIQDLSQLRVTYGRDQADVLFNTPGNVISGQASGDSARLVSEKFGRILQEKSTVSNNSKDSSVSESQQLDLALPASKIATLSSGEFVGITADSPDHLLPLKAFHAQIMLDQVVREHEKGGRGGIPEVRLVKKHDVQANFQRIKDEVEDIVTARLAEMEKIAELKCYVIQKKRGVKGSPLRQRDL